MGEWDTGHDPDCGEDYCADNIETIPIEKYFFPKEYVEGDYKRHDILLLKLIRPVVITGKYAIGNKDESVKTINRIYCKKKPSSIEIKSACEMS